MIIAGDFRFGSFHPLRMMNVCRRRRKTGGLPRRLLRKTTAFVFFMLASMIIQAVAGGGPAGAQSYSTMAEQPDPASFVKRADTGLVLLGAPIRLGGADIPWLGVRRDGDGPWRRTTAYEVQDALLTLRALGGTVVRSVTAAGTAGCSLCLEPADGLFDEQGFAALDRMLTTANDLGIRLILPLTGGGGDCSRDAAETTSICTYVRWHGGNAAAAFFNDATIRAAFLKRVRAILTHVNALTGVAYRDDPSILAWENCTACGEGADPAAVAAWTEAVGQAIKSTDQFHLYENGAFEGHILPGSPQAVPAADFATDSVDIVGDSNPPPGEEHDMRRELAKVSGAVNAAGRVYALDGFDWGPRLWRTTEALQTFLNTVFRERAVAFALVSGLEGHADSGGFIPAPTDGAAAPLYFPGIKAAGLSGEDMTARALSLRHFEYNMADILLAPSILLPPKPEIISVEHGKVTWRGAAGAASYAVERSANPDQPNSWQTLCDPCSSAEDSTWQDPAPPGGDSWYRVMPFNLNHHRALPSAPAKNH
jgi:mannan endo-1,4-beta-mannosidase